MKRKMPLNISMFMSDPSKALQMLNLVPKLSRFNIKIALLGSMRCQALTSQIQSLQIIPDLNQVLGMLVMNHLHIVISDEVLDITVPSIYTVQYWPETNELYCGSKRYHADKDIDSFILDLIKARSVVPSGFMYESKVYQFLYDTDNMNPTFTKLESKQNPSIRCLWNFTDPLTLRNKWLHLTQDSSLVLDDANATVNVVINCTMFPVHPSETIYFCMEPYGEKQYSNWLQSFQSFPQSKPLFLGLHNRHLNNRMAS